MIKYGVSYVVSTGGCGESRGMIRKCVEFRSKKQREEFCLWAYDEVMKNEGKVDKGWVTRYDRRSGDSL